MKNKLTAEQNAWLDAVINGENSILNATFGSGKTTSMVAAIEAILAKTPKAIIAVVVFTDKLKNEINDKLVSKGILTDISVAKTENRNKYSVTIKTFSGFAINLYSQLHKNGYLASANYLEKEIHKSIPNRIEYVISNNYIPNFWEEFTSENGIDIPYSIFKAKTAEKRKNLSNSEYKTIWRDFLSNLGFDKIEAKKFLEIYFPNIAEIYTAKGSLEINLQEDILQNICEKFEANKENLGQIIFEKFDLFFKNELKKLGRENLANNESDDVTKLVTRLKRLKTDVNAIMAWHTKNLKNTFDEIGVTERFDNPSEMTIKLAKFMVNIFGNAMSAKNNSILKNPDDFKVFNPSWEEIEKMAVERSWFRKFQPLDYIFVDECQDLYPLAVHLIQRLCNKTKTNVHFIGDPAHQEINQWNCGIWANVLPIIEEKFSPNKYKLSVSFRNPKKIVDLLNNDFNVEYTSTSEIEGQIENISAKDFISVNDTALLLAEKNSDCFDLMEVAIENSKQFSIKNATFEKWPKMIEYSDNLSEIVSIQRDTLSDITTKLYRQGYTSELIMNNSDYQSNFFLLKFLDILISKGIVTSPNELKEYMQKVFADNSKILTISTIHSAKGLENEVVGIYNFEELKLNSSKSKEKLDLVKVALTRTKNYLGLIPKIQK